MSHRFEKPRASTLPTMERNSSGGYAPCSTTPERMVISSAPRIAPRCAPTRAPRPRSDRSRSTRSAVCSPDPVVTPTAIAGTPRACAALASVLVAGEIGDMPTSPRASSAARTSGWPGSTRPAGRSPREAWSTVSAGSICCRRSSTSCVSEASRPASSARRSSSNHASLARTLMPSPPPIRPTFTDVPGGRGIDAIEATTRAIAWIALGESAASHAWPPGAAHDDAPTHRPDADRGDAAEVVPFDGDEGRDRGGRGIEGGVHAAQVAEPFLAHRREQPHRHAPRAERGAGRRERGQPDGVVAHARADEPVALDAHGMGHVGVEHGVEMGAEHHDRPVAAAHLRPDVAGRVGPHLAQPVGLPPRSHHCRPGRLRPGRRGHPGDLDRACHHRVGEVAHDASATPSATRASTSSRSYPSSASTSNVCSPSAGAGAA